MEERMKFGELTTSFIALEEYLALNKISTHTLCLDYNDISTIICALKSMEYQAKMCEESIRAGLNFRKIQRSE